MIAIGLEGRIARLEQYQKPRAVYVKHVSHPPKAEETEAIEKAKAEGHRFAVLPNVCTVDEWIAQYGRATLQ
jgi:hypothetical protein